MSNDLWISYYLVAFPAVERGNWHAPDALARNTPVGPALEHVTHALAAPGGDPFHPLVNFTQSHRSQSRAVENFFVGEVAGEIGSIAAVFIFLDYTGACFVHRNEPLRRGAKDHGVLTAPAVRITMIVFFTKQQHAALSHEIDDLWIGFKYIQAGEMLDFRRELTGIINRAIDFQPVLLSDHKIVVPVSRRSVHAARD